MANNRSHPIIRLHIGSGWRSPLFVRHKMRDVDFKFRKRWLSLFSKLRIHLHKGKILICEQEYVWNWEMPHKGLFSDVLFGSTPPNTCSSTHRNLDLNMDQKNFVQSRTFTYITLWTRGTLRAIVHAVNNINWGEVLLQWRERDHTLRCRKGDYYSL